MKRILVIGSSGLLGSHLVKVSRGAIIDGFGRGFDQINRWGGRDPIEKLD